MPVEHFTDFEQRRFRATFQGTVTEPDIRSHVAQRQAEHVLGFDALIDYSDAVLQVDYRDAVAFADFIQQMLAQGVSVGRTALVSPAPLNFGSNRMLSTGVEDFLPIRVFRTIDEAMNG